MRYAKQTDIDFKTMTRLEVPELCQNRQNAKMLHQIGIERCEKMAKKYSEKIREAIMQFKKGELDYVSILLLKDEILEDFNRDIKNDSLLEGVSEYEIKHIWKNTLKRLQALL